CSAVSRATEGAARGWKTGLPRRFPDISVAQGRYAGRSPLHWADAPLALIGAAHLAISLSTNLPRYSGVVRSFATSVRPAASSFSRIAGVFIAASVAARSFCTIGAGVPLGRKNAFQV